MKRSVVDGVGLNEADPVCVKGVRGAHTAFPYISQRTPQQSAPEATQMIEEQGPLNMIVFVLNDPSQNAGEVCCVLLEGPVLKTDVDTLRAYNRLMDVRNGQTALLEIGLRFRGLRDMSIDEHHGLRRHLVACLDDILFHMGDVHHEKTLRAPYLRGSKTDSVRCMHGFDHVIYELLEVRGVAFDILTDGSQYGRSQNVNGVNHGP